MCVVCPWINLGARGVSARFIAPDFCSYLQMQRNKVQSTEGQFTARISVGLCPSNSLYIHFKVLCSSRFIRFLKTNCFACLTGSLSHRGVFRHFSSVCRHAICKHWYAAFTVCVWFVFQGGPGVRGARGERGEAGLTVCKMHLISEIIYSSSKPPACNKSQIVSPLHLSCGWVTRSQLGKKKHPSS